jgi:hypothetical protein
MGHSGPQLRSTGVHQVYLPTLSKVSTVSIASIGSIGSIVLQTSQIRPYPLAWRSILPGVSTLSCRTKLFQAFADQANYYFFSRRTRNVNQFQSPEQESQPPNYYRCAFG